MKYLCCLAVVLLLGSCDPCRHIDCYEKGLRLHFRVIDSTGKDLIYDLDGSVASLNLQAQGGGKESITLDDQDKCLYVLLSPDKLNYVLSYDSRSTALTLGAEKVNDGQCCGALYETTDVSTAAGRAPVTAGITSGQRIFIIKL